MKPRDLKKTTSTERALVHFDDFYKSVYGPRWPGIRASLLCENKFAAVVNNYGAPEETREQIELKGGINLRKVFDVHYDSNVTANDTDERANQATTMVDKKLDKFVQEKQKSEFRAIYQEHVEVEAEKLALEKLKDPSRVIEMTDVVDYKKSLEKSLAEDSEYDFNRMISAEVGIMGLQEFIPATKLKGMEDFIPESEHYQYYNTTVDFPLKFEPETNFVFPKTLDIYVYPKGDISRFSRPKNTSTNVLSHFLVDAGSVLPPLMLNVQPGDVVLDACAAPGGKSLVLLQSLIPKTVVCNDSSLSRVNRLYKFFFQYLPDFTEKFEGERCIITNNEIREVNEFSKYDKVGKEMLLLWLLHIFKHFAKIKYRKLETFSTLFHCVPKFNELFFLLFQILVDVPCSNDRQSVMENENSLFKGDRTRERLQLPELQSAILVQCLQLLKPGGSLVYSTCSLSPIQNDGVVNMALTKAFTDFHITATIKSVYFYFYFKCDSN